MVRSEHHFDRELDHTGIDCGVPTRLIFDPMYDDVRGLRNHGDLAPGSAQPDESAIVPVSVLAATCADESRPNSSTTAATTARERIFTVTLRAPSLMSAARRETPT